MKFFTQWIDFDCAARQHNQFIPARQLFETPSDRRNRSQELVPQTGSGRQDPGRILALEEMTPVETDCRLGTRQECIQTGSSRVVCATARQPFKLPGIYPKLAWVQRHPAFLHDDRVVASNELA